MGTKKHTPNFSNSLFATVEEVEEAFYNALRKADIDLLMQTWADDENIFCINPGSKRYKGAPAIRAAWEKLLAESGPVSIHTQNPVIIDHGLTVIHFMLEVVTIRLPDGTMKEMLYHSSKVFYKGQMGWHLISCHLSSAPAYSIREQAGFTWLH